MLGAIAVTHIGGECGCHPEFDDWWLTGTGLWCGHGCAPYNGFEADRGLSTELGTTAESTVLSKAKLFPQGGVVTIRFSEEDMKVVI